MKRILWVTFGLIGICAAFLLWRSFSKQNTVSQTRQIFSQAFEAEITLHSGDAVLTASVGRDANGNIVLTVKEPALLAGTVIRRKGDTLTVSYGNMEFPLELQNMPATSAIEPLFSLLSGAFDSLGAEVTEKDGCYILSGESEHGPFTVTLDSKDRSVLRVDLPSIEFSCDFSKFLSLH